VGNAELYQLVRNYSENERKGTCHLGGLKILTDRTYYEALAYCTVKLLDLHSDAILCY